MPQTTYALDNPGAVPGMLLDKDEDVVIVAFPAASAIPFGRGVELDSLGTKVQLPQNTGGPIAQFAGVSVYVDTLEPGGYAAGDMVHVLRKGRIAVTTVGTAIAATDALTAANVSHKSVTATDRGKFTKAATNAGADAEVADVGAKWHRTPVTGVTDLAVIDLNLP
jgi:hypothetical protein